MHRKYKQWNDSKIIYWLPRERLFFLTDSSVSVGGKVLLGVDIPAEVWGEDVGDAVELKLNLNLDERGVEGVAMETLKEKNKDE